MYNGHPAEQEKVVVSGVTLSDSGFLPLHTETQHL